MQDFDAISCHDGYGQNIFLFENFSKILSYSYNADERDNRLEEFLHFLHAANSDVQFLDLHPRTCQF
jgi:hypothetical protein